jgi:hypothetical protein
MFSAILMFALAAAPAPAVAAATAPGGDAATLERFKTLFTLGESLYAQGEYGAAIYNFRQADALRITPEVAYDLAKCHEKLGDTAFSTFYYRLYMRRAPNASDALDVAERVGAELAHAEAEGRGLLEVEATGSGKATVDGQTFAEFPVAVFLPPGDYELTATFPSGLKKRLVSIRTGKTTTLHFEPMPPPLVMAEAGAEEWVPDAEIATTNKPGGKRSGARIASYVVLGASAAALAAGTMFGAMANGDAGRLQTETQKKNIGIGEANDLQKSANGKAGTANLLWIAGGVGAVAGGVMFVMTMPEPGMKR